MSDFLRGGANALSTGGSGSNEVRCGGRVVGQGGKQMVIGSSATSIDTSPTVSNHQGPSIFSAMNVPSSVLPSTSNGVGGQIAYFTPQSHEQAPQPPSWFPANDGAQEVQNENFLSDYSCFDFNKLLGDSVLVSSQPQLSLSDQSIDGQTTSTLQTETYYLPIAPDQQNGQQCFQFSSSSTHNQGLNYAQVQQPQRYPLQNVDWKPDMVFQGFDNCQNAKILNDDQNSRQSSLTNSSTPSPKPQLTIPPNQNYPGPCNFRIHLVSAPLFKEKKTPPWTYSQILNRLFCKAETSTPIGFSCETPPPQGARIQCMAIFSSPAYIQESVTRCPHHVQNDTSAHKTHFIRAEHADAHYGLDLAFSRESVTIPHEKPQPGMNLNEYILKFMCLNTCQGGINRRETQVVFTLLSAQGAPLGRAVIDLRVCASPGRDRKKEEAKHEKLLEKESSLEVEANAASGGPSASVKSTKRKMDTATVTTHVTTVSFDQDASGAVPKTKRPRMEAPPRDHNDLAGVKEEETGEIFTITTRHKEDYEILLKMKEGLELARMATTEQRDAVKRKVLSEVSHDPSYPPKHIYPSVVRDASPPISNGDAATEAVRNESSDSSDGRVPRRVPDEDSTTKSTRGERERNLYEAAVNGVDLEDGMDCIGVEERSTQPFTGIKEPNSVGSSETDILRGLSDIFDGNANFSVIDDGASNKKTARSKKQNDNNNNDNKSADKSIAEWLSSFGMVAYTDLFKENGVAFVKDLEDVDQSSLNKLKLSKAHTNTIWREITKAKEKGRFSSFSPRRQRSSTDSLSPEDSVIPSLERMGLRGMSRFKKEGGVKLGEEEAVKREPEKTPNVEDEATNLSEASEKTAINLASRLPLTRKPSSPSSPSSQLHFFSQPSELPSSKIESVSPHSASQPTNGSGQDYPRLTASSHTGIPSRSLGSLSQFLRDQVGSFGLSSSHGTLNSSAGDLASRMKSGGVLKVRKFTFKHSFSLAKD